MSKACRLGIAVVLAAWGCGGETGGADPGPLRLPPDGGGPPPAVDGPPPAKTCTPGCVSPNVCDPKTVTCVPPGQCGSEEVGIELVAPNLLIVLDRSCSMKTKVGAQSKWQIAVAAVKKLGSSYQGLIRFGLTMFPDITGDNCTQAKIPVPIAIGAEAKIQSLLTAALASTDAYYPDGPCVTNIDTAMQQAATEPALADATRASYVLLLTDGQQSGCSVAGGDAGTTQIIKDLRNKKVPTFVVGFGGEVDPAQLNIFADAGGKPAASPTTRYYKAEDQTSLDAALKAISKQAASCVLQLKKVPASLVELHVFFDKTAVSQDKTHQQGWDYDAASNRLTFYGKPCTEIEQSLVTDIRILYGCAKPSEPPGPKTCPSGPSCNVKEDCPAKTTCLAGCCVGVVE